MREAITIGGTRVEPGTRGSVELEVVLGYTASPVMLPIQVVHGKRSGPSLLVCAALHGDEINGVEIVRRLLSSTHLSRLRGTLIAVPIVNVQGFIARDRYLPDRRDLNRSFPGSPRGSVAARLAYSLLSQVVVHATHVIDLHTAARHRNNLPQVRAHLEAPGVLDMAKAFGVPVVLHSGLREGSLRASLHERNIPAVVYEAGEALRFDEVSIRAGVRGIFGVMRLLDMLPERPRRAPVRQPVMAVGSRWARAPEGGIVTARVRLGQNVRAGEVLAIISDPIGREQSEVKAEEDAVVIGCATLPLVNEGDALFHLAIFRQPEAVAHRVEAFHDSLDPEAAMR